MRTSEITARLQHKSTAVTRKWIHDRGLEEVGIDVETRENQYDRAAVEKAIEDTVQRGPYRKRPSDEEPPHDHDRVRNE